ncbi:hypothetical protein T484DRAFT_1798822 [Baffinella frigidus]|nr:hypothetical protein T484DRAFT_1798822 [Cryptophyta sp. CCMP2293]
MWGNGSFDVLACETSDCLMLHAVSVLVGEINGLTSVDNTEYVYACPCDAGGGTCTDPALNNCDLMEAGTSDDANCTNTFGSFVCACARGYTDNTSPVSAAGVDCVNIDECAVATHNCDPFANCTDTPGSFTCACRPGYTDTGSGLAVDDGFGGTGDCTNTTI